MTGDALARVVDVRIEVDVVEGRVGTRATQQLRHPVAGVGDRLGDLAVGVVEIARQPRLSRTGVHAGRGDTLLHPVDAEGALVHGMGVVDREVVVGGDATSGLGLVQEARAVGAVGDAAAAADAAVLVHVDQAVRALVGRPRPEFLLVPVGELENGLDRRRRATLEADRLVAMVAPPGEVEPLGVGVCALLTDDHGRAEDAQPHVVLRLAGDRAGLAALAPAEVDEESPPHLGAVLLRVGCGELVAGNRSGFVFFAAHGHVGHHSGACERPCLQDFSSITGGSGTLAASA